MAETTKHYVTFYYPGSFFDEDETREIAARGQIGKVPRGAFGYQEWDREERSIDGETLKGQPKNRGPMVYFGEVLTADDVKKLPGDHGILLSNMRGNNWPRVVRTVRGNFKPLTDDVCVLAPEAKP
jgi:hypothetical protein